MKRIYQLFKTNNVNKLEKFKNNNVNITVETQFFRKKK